MTIPRTTVANDYSRVTPAALHHRDESARTIDKSQW
jgi:hypothetical protein